MTSPIAEYLISLGFKLDDIASKRFGETLITTAANFLKLKDSAIDAAFEVGKAVEEIASNYESLYYLSQRTGSTIQSLQATAFGFGQVGMKAEDAKGMVDQLGLSLKFNPGTNAILQLLGVPITGDANAEMMGALHRLRNMNPILQKGFGEQLGMNPFQLSMLLAPGALEKIEKAGAELTKAQQDANVNPMELGKQAVALENSLKKLEAEFGVLSDHIVGPLIVPLTHIADNTTAIVAWFAGLSFSKGQAVWDRVRDRGAGVDVDAAGADVGHMLGAALGGGKTGGGASAGQAGWWTPERQQHAIQALVAGGVSPLGAAALVSRWVNVESAGGPGSVNPDTGAFGIGQWLGSRQSGIAGDTDFDHQLDYVLRELHSSEGRALGALNSASTPWDAARGASIYERAHGYNSALGTDDFTGTTAANITIGAPNTTIHVTGGADPQTTADYVLKGQTGVWDDVFRNAGTAVR